MAKQPDHAERSAAIAEECENDVALKEARKEIFAGLLESIHILKALRDNSDEDSVRLNAVKHHLKLAGLEVEQTQMSGPNGQPLGVVFLPAREGME